MKPATLALICLSLPRATCHTMGVLFEDQNGETIGWADGEHFNLNKNYPHYEQAKLALNGKGIRTEDYETKTTTNR